MASIIGKGLSGRSTVKKKDGYRGKGEHAGDAAEKESEHTIYLFNEYLLVSKYWCAKS